MFVDRVTITVVGGTGGSGAEAFRREKGVPRGGPSGGDGGHGGGVVLVCDPQLTTLLDFRYQAEYRAPRGEHGEGSNRTGAERRRPRAEGFPGDDGPRPGRPESSWESLLTEGERLVVARGGRGGRGNARFATATDQAPRRWEPGKEGMSRTIELTLKLIADVGLVGEPNAGKSTLLASVTAARPKVADYPFTTLAPHLGVVALPQFRSFVMADLPGIIEGAHEGRGLGHRFLQHIERTRALALLVPVDDPDPQGTYDRLRVELARYSEALARRPHCLVLTKADLLAGEGARTGGGSAVEPASEARAPGVHAPDAWGRFVLSSVTRRGVAALLEALWSRVRADASEPVVDGDVEADRTSTSGMDEAEWWSALDQEI